MLTKVSKQPTPVPRTQGNTSAWITVRGRAAFSVYAQAGLLGQNVQIQVRGVLSDLSHIEEVLKAPVRVLRNLSVVSVLSAAFILAKCQGN